MLKQVLIIGLIYLVSFALSAEIQATSKSEVKSEAKTEAKTETKTATSSAAAGQSMEQSASETETESDMKLPPGVKKQDYRRSKNAVFTQEFTMEETRAIYSWSLGFWFRWSVRDPYRAIDIINSNHNFLCGVSEKQNPDARAYGHNNLGMLIGQFSSSRASMYNSYEVPIHMWTHSTNIGQNVERGVPQYMRLADLDSTWVYTYAWHDTTVAGLGWIMYSSRYGRYYEDNWGNIVHYYTFNKQGPLGFYVGGHPNNARYAFPGYFFDINVQTFGNVAVPKTPLEVYTNFISKNRKPPQMNPDPNYVQLVGDTEQVSKFKDTFSESSQQYKKIYKFAGAEEWSIQGWFKLASDTEFLPDANSDPYSLLLRVSLNEHGQGKGDDGFRSLMVFQDMRKSYRNNFVCYLSNWLSSFTTGGVTFTVPDSQQYFWLHLSFNAPKKLCNFYIRQGRYEKLDITTWGYQFIPKFFGVYLGKDDGQNLVANNAFNGVMRNVYLRVGAGAFNRLAYFDDNFINMKDMNCAMLYSDCMYQGNSYQVCASQNTFDPNFPVWSIKLPFGKKLKLYSQSNMNGNAVEFTLSQECLKKINFTSNSTKLLQMEYKGMRFLENHEINTMVEQNLEVHFHDPEQMIN